MLRIFLIISATVATVSSALHFNKYRNIATCEGRPHIFWVYRPLYASWSCHKVMQNGLTAIEKKTILDHHNKLRQKVARGEKTRGSPGPQPAATEMPKLEWDDELAGLAQRWAQQCNFDLDQCRDVGRFKVNQLISYYQVSEDILSITVETMINRWYAHVKTVDNKFVSNYSLVTYIPESKEVSSYTQIVWAKTTKIGCGGIKNHVPDKDGQTNRFFLVCNYGPSGNIIGKSVYKTC